jgi:hypothetical protein
VNNFIQNIGSRLKNHPVDNDEPHNLYSSNQGGCDVQGM